MQTSLLNLLDDPPPAPGWVEECPGRWVRYSHPWRLMVQQDRPGVPWRWSAHRWPGVAPRADGEAAGPQEGARKAEQALVTLGSG
jgi:hypothetical protein